MKKGLTLLLLAVCCCQLSAQEFIGCRVGDGWAEAPMLRKRFRVENPKEINFQSKKIMWVASLGYHEVYVNGIEIGDYVMQPAVSQLDKRANLVSYDITDYIHPGENEVMIWLGQGWGRIYEMPAVVWARVMNAFGDELTSLAFTDNTWEASPSGYNYTGSWQPQQFGGERFDARVKPAWRPASVAPITPIQTTREWELRSQESDKKCVFISSQQFNGNRIVDALLPQSVDTLADGSFMLDFGRVVTGWFQADCLPIPEGDEIIMEYFDKPNSSVGEKDIYISDGNGDDDIHFTNRFHMHSFRYVKVSGLGHYLSSGLDCPIVNGSALQIGAVDPKEGATFECSDSCLNAIHDLVKYTLSCLTFSGYMVDCPHIERMGYGGDGNSSTMTLQTLWDVRDTYRNWMQAWGDAMDSVGDLPYVAPAFRTGGGPYWSGFIVKAPWRTYLNYGDTTLIIAYYDQMKRWLQFVEEHSEDDILQPWPDTKRHSWFLGDWLAPEGVDIGGESVLHASSCFISECLRDMEQMAQLTGHPADVRLFAERRGRVKAAIHRHFYHPESHTYANGTPLDQCYALLMEVPPDSATRQAVRAQLLKDCHGKYRDHIAAGLMGVPIFTEWCIRERQADLMATLLRQPDYPGYLHMIHNGATTTWESWDCGRPNKEDRSRVHNCYNGIGIWFYQALAGIRPDPEQPGYRHFFVDPQPVSGVEWVRASKPTPFGTIRVEIKEGIIQIDIPAGTTATLFPNTPNQQTLLAGHHHLTIKNK